MKNIVNKIKTHLAFFKKIWDNKVYKMRKEVYYAKSGLWLS